MEITDFISFGALILSIIAFLYTYFTNTKRYELHFQYRAEILSWYKETNQILIHLRVEAEKNSNNGVLKRELLSRLSSNIELGRFYFPNIIDGINYGKNKPIAYQGFRNLTLDFLVFSYRLFDKNDANQYLDHAEALQRYFTSSVFEIVEPRNFLKQTEKHTSKAFNKELSFEDFIDQDPKLLEKYIMDY
jgi:hypothetical protein